MRAYVVRGARLWLLARLALSAVFLLSGENPLELTPAGTLVVVVLATGLGFVEFIRRHERALFGNLGLSRLYLAAFSATPALVGELLIRAIVPPVR